MKNPMTVLAEIREHQNAGLDSEAASMAKIMQALSRASEERQNEGVAVAQLFGVLATTHELWFEKIRGRMVSLEEELLKLREQVDGEG